MNHISSKQNQDKQIKYLAASRELYGSAKNVHLLQFILTVCLPVGFSIAAMLLPSIAIGVAFYGITVFLIDQLFIDPLIKEYKEKAASIQELFDCSVLDIRQSKIKVSQQIDIESILTSYNAHAKIKTNIEKIKDWYSKEASNVPVQVGRVICQRTNCWWDGNLKRRYASFIKICAFAVVICIFAAAMALSISIQTLILILSGMVPFFQFVFNQTNLFMDAAKRLDVMRLFSENLFARIILSDDVSVESELDSRMLQDEIFENRKNGPLVFNWIYFLFRDKTEDAMNCGAAELVEEYNNAVALR